MADAFPGTDRPLQIIPSVLPADFSRLGEVCRELEVAGVDRIQFDVMDGRFVPNLTFGPDVVASLRSHVSVPFEAHLMVHEPAWMFDAFVEAGCELLIVHAESVGHLHRAVAQARSAGARVGVALNPATGPEALDWVLEDLDMVLVMTVNPGFGGQAYISSMEPKVAALRTAIVDRGLDVDVEVDGGIGPATIAGSAAAGANWLVAGSSLFNHPDGMGAAVTELRQRATEAAATGRA